MSSKVDVAGAVRDGEALDVDAVQIWLREYVPDLQGPVEVTQYSGGASNWTYRLRFQGHDLILRRPPSGTIAKSAHDMAREFEIQRALKPHFPAVPQMIALCQDPSVLGCDFYVMERVAGIIPRARLPVGVHLDRDQVQRLCTEALDALVALHRVNPEKAGLQRLSRGDGYCRRQVEGWDKRYEAARTWNVPTFKGVRSWLMGNTPADVANCLLHNDWRFDNLVLDESDPTRILCVLDWELAALGDPLMELGSMLAYWVEASDGPLMRATRRQPTHLAGMLTRQEVVDYYLAKTGLKVSNWTFYEVFGLFRLAAIAQQIYFRYHHKQTRNPAFRHYWVLIHFLHWRCKQLIRRGST